MTAISDRKFIMQQEETKFNSAVSESLVSRMGAVTNFIVNRELTQHDFNLNGKYNIIPAPYQFGDGYITYPFPFEIVDVMLFTGEAVGTSGTTEIDVKWKPESSGSFATIFSTTPKVTGSSPINRFVRVGGPGVTGMNRPVLSKTTFNAYDYLRLDVLQHRAGNVNGIFLKIFVRPRDPA
jgi:hypothetical protein